MNVGSTSTITAINFTNGYITNVGGHLSGNLLTNLSGFGNSRVNFEVGSSLTFNQIENYGTINISELITVWSFSGIIKNSGRLISLSSETVISENTNFNSTNFTTFKDLSIRDGAVFSISEIYRDGGNMPSHLYAQNIVVDDGGTADLRGFQDFDHLVNYGNTTIYARSMAEADVENYGHLTLRYYIAGSLHNGGVTDLIGSIAGDFVSTQGSEVFIPILPDTSYQTGYRVTPLSVGKDVLWTGVHAHLDLVVKNNSKLVVHGNFAGSDVTLDLNPYSGQFFSSGELFTLIQLQNANSSIFFDGTVNALNQHQDFAYVTGVLAGTNDLVFKPLNSGATGGVGVLDLSAGQTGAEFSSADGASFGSVRGGTFDSVQFASLQNVTSVKGTDFADNMTAYEYGTGTPKAFFFNGMKGNDTLQGARGDDTLDGGDGDDILNGGAGIDTALGGAGHDTIFVNNAQDIVIEALNQGTDRVRSTVDYVLGKGVYVEALATVSATTTAPIKLTGNEFNQTIEGNNGVNTLSGMAGKDILKGFAGADQLFGGIGNDTLTGGSGDDQFVFNTALNSSANVDTLTDFGNVAGNNDLLVLENAIFAGLNTGALAADFFKANASGLATQSDDLLVYNTSTGNLYYDSNGNAAGGRTLFATLSGHPSLTAADFLII